MCMYDQTLEEDKVHANVQMCKDAKSRTDGERQKQAADDAERHMNSKRHKDDKMYMRHKDDKMYKHNRMYMYDNVDKHRSGANTCKGDVRHTDDAKMYKSENMYKSEKTYKSEKMCKYNEMYNSENMYKDEKMCKSEKMYKDDRMKNRFLFMKNRFRFNTIACITYTSLMSSSKCCSKSSCQ